tara:strand:+ start:109 stop:744 length:636 start_codon:yes stop_codon:yes gene_type:complete
MLGFAPISAAPIGSAAADDGFTNGAATIACAASVSAASERIQNGAATIACATSTSSAAEIVRIYEDGESSIAVTSSVSATAIKYSIYTGTRAGYGVGTYGTFSYGINEKTENAASVVAGTSSATAAGQRVPEITLTIACASSATSSAVFDVISGATIACVSTFTSNAGSTLKGAASPNCVTSTSAVCEIKWTEAAAANTNWTEADLLERAA